MQILFSYNSALNDIGEKIKEKSEVIAHLYDSIGLKISDQCISALNGALKSLGVERQAYHSQSFIGNHCHKLLKVRYKTEKKVLVYKFDIERI